MEHLTMHGSFITGGLPILFLFGLLMSFNPCMLAMLPLAGGYTAGGSGRGIKRAVLPVVIWLSFAGALAVQGLAAGLLGGALGGLQKMLPYLLGMLYLLLGAYLLNWLGRTKRLLPFGVHGFYVRSGSSRSGRTGGLPGAISLGVILGLTPAPCITPIVLAILGYAVNQGDPGQAVMMLFSYGLGHGLLLVLAGVMGRWMYRFSFPWLRPVSGMILLGLGSFFLLNA
ncbi:MAG: cytochrome c biogenesis CcdA family protein [Bacillota bacterium]